MKPPSAGMTFGALIIGVGVAYLVYQKTQKAHLAAIIGMGAALADLILLSLFASRGEK